MRSGIYQIRNRITGKVYIGSAWNCELRRTGHFNKLRAGIHHSVKLQRSYNKHGERNFEFTILERCERKDLLIREQYWFDRLKPWYNICPIAGSSRGRKSSTAQLKSLRRGWEKRAVVLSKRVRQLDLQGVPIKVWNSIAEACRQLELFPQSIAFVCKGKQKTAGNCIWQYE